MSLPVYFITWKNSTDITSAAEAHDVGCLRGEEIQTSLCLKTHTRLPGACGCGLHNGVNTQLISDVFQLLDLFGGYGCHLQGDS